MITDTNVESSSYVMPTEECYDAEGKVIKEVYMRQFPDFNKHEIKMTKKKIYKFIEKNPKVKHYRLEVLGTPLGCNFYFTGNQYIPTERQKEKFFKEVWESIDSVVTNVKAFDFNTSENYDSLEIWGINENDKSVIMFLYIYDNGVIEIGDED